MKMRLLQLPVRRKLMTTLQKEECCKFLQQAASSCSSGNQGVKMGYRMEFYSPNQTIIRICQTIIAREVYP